MNYKETVEYLYAQLPAFQNSGKKAIKPSLKNIEKLCHHLGDPHLKFKSIHVAGTNGKGSSSHMLASIFQEAGYKTGLYTSPHLKDFRERFKINGKLVDEVYVINFVNKHKQYIAELKPSFFEVTVGMAFELFAKEEVDIAIIETGLGGRLDSTNIINPILSLITNIGFDHTDVLGDTLEEIAFEKAGIIKENVPVIISEKSVWTSDVFNKQAKSKNSEIIYAQEQYIGRLFKEQEGLTMYLVDSLKDNNELGVSLDLQGNYQKQNLIGVLACVNYINNSTSFHISTKSLTDGLSKVVKNTDLKGRWQKLGSSPLTICDTGHNPHSFQRLATYLEQNNYSVIHFILGFSAEKDLLGTLGILPKNAKYYFSTFNSLRSKTVEEFDMIASEFNIKDCIVFPNVNDALKEAQGRAKENDFIYIGGSTYLVAELENL